MSILNELCSQTDTQPDDWEQLDHPESGVGIERWYRNLINGDEYYCCEDQGEITISKCKEEL